MIKHQEGVDTPSSAMLERLAADPFLDPTSMTPLQMRTAFDAFYASVDMTTVNVDVEDNTFSGPNGPVQVRLYRPPGARSQPLPITLFYKGGGLMMGSLDSFDAIARRLCRSSESLLVSVAYRQPPENRFPAAYDDCVAALEWARAHADELGGDGSRMAVAGESGGGALAASVTHAALDRGGPRLSGQVLAYPAVSRSPDSESMQAFARGYWFEPETMDWLYSQYVDAPESMTDPRVQPGLRQNLQGLPPAHILYAEYDILRDDVLAYARRLQEAGVPVELERYGRTVHGFLNMGGVIPYAAEALDRAGDFLKRVFAEQG